MLVFVLSVFTMIRSILNVSSFRSSVNLNRRLRVIGISPILHFSKKKTSIAELSENAAREELKILNADLNLHDKLYYEEGKPSLSDSAYDKFVLRAENIIGKYPSLNSLIDKFQRVGCAKSNKFSDFIHSTPMLSLDNCFNEEDLMKFFDRIDKALGSNHSIEYIIEPKIDGLSLAIQYENGKFLKAGTRGDGKVGEDVTDNVRQLLSHAIPMEIPNCPLLSLEIRGEVYLPKENFIKLNKLRLEKEETAFATTRNAASGLLRRITNGNGEKSVSLKDSLSSGLDFFAYALYTPFTKAEESASTTSSTPKSSSMAPVESQSQIFEYLQKFGFHTATPRVVCDTSAGVQTEAKKMLENKSQWPYDADGVVVKVNHLTLQAKLGTATRFPKWALAYKHNTQESVTVCEEIKVQVGRTGVLTPVAVLQSVLLGGVNVTRATLHNEHEVNRLGMFAGCRVRVQRAGDVIPKITGVVTDAADDADDSENAVESGHNDIAAADDSNQLTKQGGETDYAGGGGTYRLPERCPVCNSPTQREHSDADASVVTVRCTATHTCPAQVTERIRHFCSRDALNIDGISAARIEDIYQHGLIRNVADLFTLRDRDMLPSNNISNNNSMKRGGAGTSMKAVKETRKKEKIDQQEHEEEGAVSLRSLSGWGDRSVNNLLGAVDKARTTNASFSRLLYGLGIRHIGKETAKDIEKAFDSDFTAFWHYLRHVARVVDDAGRSGSSDKISHGKAVSSSSGIGKDDRLGAVAAFDNDELLIAVMEGQKELKRKSNGGASPLSRKSRSKKADNSSNSNYSASAVSDENISAAGAVPAFPVGLWDKLLAIDGLGPVAVVALTQFARDVQNVALVEELMKHLKLQERTAAVSAGGKTSKTASSAGKPSVNSAKGDNGGGMNHATITSGEAAASTSTSSAPAAALPLTGRKVVFTGKLSSMSRKEAEALCSQLGGEAHATVDNEVNLVIAAGDIHSSKVKAAQAKGIEIWSEEEWQRFLAK